MFHMRLQRRVGTQGQLIQLLSVNQNQSPESGWWFLLAVSFNFYQG